MNTTPETPTVLVQSASETLMYSDGKIYVVVGYSHFANRCFLLAFCYGKPLAHFGTGKTGLVFFKNFSINII